MARTQCNYNQQAFSRIGRNAKGAHETPETRSQSDISEEERIEKEKEMKALQKKHQDTFIWVYEEKEIVYSDQRGKFPTTSSRINKYLMVL